MQAHGPAELHRLKDMREPADALRHYDLVKANQGEVDLPLVIPKPLHFPGLALWCQLKAH